MKKIYYCYDALCGWCYGFSPVVQSFYLDHREEVEFEVLSGGMIRGDRVGPIGEVAGYISEAYRVVEERCGVTFGEAFLHDILREGSAVFTSLPASVALSIVKAEKPGQQFPFAAALHRAVYQDGIRPAEPEAYGKLAENFGFEAAVFTQKMNDQTFQQAAEADFERCAGFGVTGFPTLVLETSEGKLYALARGYVAREKLDKVWEQAKTM